MEVPEGGNAHPFSLLGLAGKCFGVFIADKDLEAWARTGGLIDYPQNIIKHVIQPMCLFLGNQGQLVMPAPDLHQRKRESRKPAGDSLEILEFFFRQGDQLLRTTDGPDAPTETRLAVTVFLRRQQLLVGSRGCPFGLLAATES